MENQYYRTYNLHAFETAPYGALVWGIYDGVYCVDENGVTMEGLINIGSDDEHFERYRFSFEKAMNILDMMEKKDL